MSRRSRKLRRAFFGFPRFLWHHKRSAVLCIIAVCFLLGGVLLLWASTLQIPALSSIENREVKQSVQIYDRTGTVLLYTLNSDAQRVVVPISEISPNIQHAVVSVEDPTFYTNSGVDFSGMARAFLVDLSTFSYAQGASTITQQVVKNTLLTDDKSIARKIEEIILALKLTRVLTKDQVLEIYLNQAPFAGNVYGVETASEQFFGVPASEDSVPEAAYLAAMLPAPSYLSPYGPHKAALDQRKNLVLERMYNAGYLTSTQLDQAKNAVVIFQPQQESGITAPHFVFYVENYLEQKYGQDVLDQNSWKVITTLDVNLQTEAEEAIKTGMVRDQKLYNASNAGLIAIDPRNGQILAMVGSRDYFDTAIDGNFNVTTAPRQPGSTFKPFEYAEAFEKGYTPNTVLFDVPTQFSTSCAPTDFYNDDPPCYAPVDYDDKWRGPMTMRDAIAQSINVPSVEVLDLAGISDTLKLAKAMGVTMLGDASQYGLSLALGAGDVTLLQMTSAYGSFAQNGVHYPTTPILKIVDQNGNIIEDDTHPEGTQVMPKDAAEEINDVLSDPVARAPLGENEYLEFPGYDVAVKTGTTNNYVDAWTIGYTPNFVLGIWVGNNNATPMSHVVSGFMVGPMWNQVMSYELASSTPAYFDRSDETIPTSASNVKPVLRGIWQGGQTTVSNGMEYVTCDPHNILYWINTNDLNGPSPGPNSTDPQYPYWEAALQHWLGNNGSLGCTPGQQILIGPYAPPLAQPPEANESTTDPQMPEEHSFLP